MTDTEKDVTEKQPLPRAQLASLSRRERLGRQLRWIKRGLLALMAMALVGSFGVAVVFGARACEAKAKEISASAYAACSLLNNVIVGDIMRIKRADNDGRYILYIQPRDSIAVKIQEVYCDQLDFLADVPSGAPMYGVRRTWMNGRFCNCGMTYHIHAITDPNVE